MVLSSADTVSEALSITYNGTYEAMVIDDAGLYQVLRNQKIRRVMSVNNLEEKILKCVKAVCIPI
jgi:hypothetical protein